MIEIERTLGNSPQHQTRFQQAYDALTTHFKGKIPVIYFTWSLETVLYSEPGFYHYCSSGYNLQRNQNKQSFLTHTHIKGAPFTFEDGKTMASQEEAMEYSLCIRYSPLNTGYRFNPY